MKLAPFHSITSSARPSSVIGKVRPRAFAVLSRDVAARTCKAGDKAVRNGRRGAAENDGNFMCLARELGELRNGVGEDHVRLETHELRRIGAGALDIATAPAQVDADVVVFRPSKLLQTLSED